MSFDDLPDEVILQIFSLLDTRTRLGASSTSRRFDAVAHDQSFETETRIAVAVHRCRTVYRELCNLRDSWNSSQADFGHKTREGWSKAEVRIVSLRVLGQAGALNTIEAHRLLAEVGAVSQEIIDIAHLNDRRFQPGWGRRQLLDPRGQTVIQALGHLRRMVNLLRAFAQHLITKITSDLNKYSFT